MWGDRGREEARAAERDTSGFASEVDGTEVGGRRERS